MDWFLYDKNLRHERFKALLNLWITKDTIQLSKTKGRLSDKYLKIKSYQNEIVYKDHKNFLYKTKRVRSVHSTGLKDLTWLPGFWRVSGQNISNRDTRLYPEIMRLCGRDTKVYYL